jgi:hypothetical protein
MTQEPAVKPILALVLTFSLLAPTVWAGQAAPVIDVYKSPTCGCCSKWIDHLKASGFAVRSHDTADVVRHKIRLGIPQGYDSCHTAEVGGYVIEGHVPAKDIKRLLKEKPVARGLTVPGMPIGSPGMEQGGHKDVYDVILLGKDGTPQVYSRY